MSISLVSLKCPDCGAQLNIEQGRKEVFCSYCGAKILVNNENEHVYRYIDEAALKRAETEHMVRMEEMEAEKRRQEQEEEQRRAEQMAFAQQEEKRKKKRRTWIIAGVLVMLLGPLSQSGEGAAYSMLLSLLLILLGFLFTKSPDNSNSPNGQTVVKKIKVPSSISEYEKKSYSSIEAILQGKGFTNIRCVPLNDLKVGLLQKPGTVESITINGHSVKSKSGGKKFPSDAAVVISYHSFADK